MTDLKSEEKLAQRARLRDELAAKKAERVEQLKAYNFYLMIARYNINARACPREFFLFWARHLAWAAPYIVRGFINGFGRMVGFIYFLPVIFVVFLILCAIFPPLLIFIELLVFVFLIGVIVFLTLILLCIAGYVPIFMAVLKRRINDVSKTAAEAHSRFLLFVFSLSVIPLTLLACCCSWAGFSLFTTGGALHWLVNLACVILIFSVASIVCQMYYYTNRAGVIGENFAGTNPVEVPITHDSIAQLGGQTGSRLWHIVAIVLMVCAAVISFAASYSFIALVQYGGKIDFLLHFISPIGLSWLLYGLQTVSCLVALVVLFMPTRAKKGMLSDLEIARINACFMPQYPTVTDELRNSATQSLEIKRKQLPPVLLSVFSKLKFAFKILISPCYYLVGIIVLVLMVKLSPVFMCTLPIIAVVLMTGCRYVHYRMLDDIESADLKKLFVASSKQLLSIARTIAMWPFLKAEKKSVKMCSPVVQKQVWVKNVSFIDPLGLHHLALGDVEMCGIQTMFCILIIGIPFSWLWSIFDGLRYANMKEDEFLRNYPEYCAYRGKWDRILSGASWFAQVIVGPVVTLAAIMAIAFA